MEKNEEGSGPTDPQPGAAAGAASHNPGGQPSDGAAPEIPGYAVGRLLGRGGSASVWHVTETLTKREFAVKCLSPAVPPAGQEQGGALPLADNPAAAEAVRREVHILSALDHQHLVKAYDVVRLGGAAGGSVGLVMDYAAGGSLEQLVTARRALSIGETVTVLTPIAQALGYLHGNGFTHSDVSPGNVLFSAHGKPLLADLGVTRMVGDSADPGAGGTEGFLDPAPVDAVRAGLQPERDVYSVAAIGWYCLTGKVPEIGANRPPLSLLVPGVPAALAAALESGLKEDRRARPTAAEFAAAVYRSAEAAPVDLAGSVHPSVVPQLLTRRKLPESGLTRRAALLRAWRRTIAARPEWRTGRPPRGRERRRAQPIGRSGDRPIDRRRIRAGARLSGRRLWIGCVTLALACATASIWFVEGPVQRAVPPPLSGPAGAAGPAGPTTAGRSAPAVPEEISRLLLSSDPAEAAHGLAWLRSTAFSSGSFELLDDVNAADSGAAAADKGISARLVASGHVLAGFRTTLTRVETAPESTGSRAVVDIRSVTSAYQETDSAGAVVAAGPAGAEAELRLVLVLADGRWRIQEILPPG